MIEGGEKLNFEGGFLNFGVRVFLKSAVKEGNRERPGSAVTFRFGLMGLGPTAKVAAENLQL